jgi:hypothetical protein
VEVDTRIEICTVAGCGGQMHPLPDLYLHTLGGDIFQADFREFIECRVKRCHKCGNIQLLASDTPVRAEPQS